MKMKIASLLLMATVALAGCSSAKEKIGLTKKSPDEFSVVKRAPLSMPPDYGLRPPAPGAPRPQEQSPQEEARQTVFGSGGEEAVYEEQVTGTDSAFLNKAGAAKSDPSIRQKVDAETTILDKKERPVVKRLLGMDGKEHASATVVDAKEEAARLKNNKDQGKPVTDGETPSLEQ